MSFTPSRSQSPVSSESDPAVGPCPFLIQVYHQFHTRNHILDVLDDVVPSIEIYGWMNMSLYELGVFIAEKILFQQEDTKHPEWMLQFRFVFHDRFKGRPSSRDMDHLNINLFHKATGILITLRLQLISHFAQAPPTEQALAELMEGTFRNSLTITHLTKCCQK